MSEEVVGEILELPQTDYQKQMPGEEEEAVAQATEISIESVEEGNVQVQDEVSAVKQVLFQDQDDDSSSSDYGSHDKPGTVLQRLMPDGNVLFPDMFQTNQLLFYERFKAYQDYMLGDCRTSEVKDFTAEYLEKVLEPSGWQAVWRTELFDVLIEVVDVEYLVLKADVELVTPFLCETKGCELTEESMKDLLEAKEHKVPVQELYVVYDESGEFDQTALAVEHVRFFYKHIWRSWDEEDEDDDFDYFVRCVEPRLMLYVLGYQVNSGLQSNRAKGPRPTRERMVHVVSSSMTVSQLQTLMRDKLCPDFSGEEFELQFHSDPLVAVNACYEGDVVVICPGHYSVNGSFSIPDSIELEGFGLTDEVVIEKVGKGDIFLDLTGANVKVSNLKFVQHDAVEGILCVRQGKTVMENCVLQCETTGVTVRTSAELFMDICDLYGAKGAGVEIYPGSTCSLVGNGIHHCKEGILIKDFTDEFYTMPKITMMNNVIHNNEGYGVILVKPTDLPRMKKTTEADFQDESKENGGQKKRLMRKRYPLQRDVGRETIHSGSPIPRSTRRAMMSSQINWLPRRQRKASCRRKR
ncbi:SHC SH2 domain-binding protein 1-like isoform X3 [Acipenser ruthenus]|uniref:SHC SH2 domain-binding protein 1-like isoform X3 n=1 Tax=Acipenser ruthenus TaxID=7906 RepID=UPI00145AF13F|nr:SHC SH2 domain-binding protein 1-like isoform X3 [Acipenser ruthenus]